MLPALRRFLWGGPQAAPAAAGGRAAPGRGRATGGKGGSAPGFEVETLFLVFSANLAGIVCARSIHYQFYSWWARMAGEAPLRGHACSVGLLVPPPGRRGAGWAARCLRCVQGGAGGPPHRPPSQPVDASQMDDPPCSRCRYWHTLPFLLLRSRVPWALSLAVLAAIEASGLGGGCGWLGAWIHRDSGGRGTARAPAEAACLATRLGCAHRGAALPATPGSGIPPCSPLLTSFPSLFCFAFLLQLVYNVYPPRPWAAALLLAMHAVLMLAAFSYRGTPGGEVAALELKPAAAAAQEEEGEGEEAPALDGPAAAAGRRRRRSVAA